MTTVNTVKKKVRLSPFRTGTLEINKSTGRVYLRFRYGDKIYHVSGSEDKNKFIPEKEHDLFNEWLSKPRKKRSKYLFTYRRVNTLLPDIQHGVKIYKNTGSARMSFKKNGKRYNISGILKDNVFHPTKNIKMYLSWITARKEDISVDVKKWRNKK